jgi:hypothetical protein
MKIKKVRVKCMKYTKYIRNLLQINGNKNFTQEMQLEINNNDIVFKYIPYDQFIDIKGIGKGSPTVYSSIWMGYVKGLTRSDNKAALACLSNTQDTTNEFLDEV